MSSQVERKDLNDKTVYCSCGKKCSDVKNSPANSGYIQFYCEGCRQSYEMPIAYRKPSHRKGSAIGAL